MIHQWLYFIGPTFEQARRYAGGKADPQEGHVYLFAYCKGCNRYFVENIPVPRYGSAMYEAHVPREGCNGNRAPLIPEVISEG